MAQQELITLAEVHEVLTRRRVIPRSSYGHLRTRVARSEALHVAGLRLAVWKKGRAWCTDRAAFDEFLVQVEHELERRRLAEQAADAELRLRQDRVRRLYAHRVLLDDSAGLYRIVDEHFHAWRVVSLEPYSDWSLSWVCSHCFAPAQYEHGREECHRCSDWSGCGSDCTLSAATCPPCGTAHPL